MDDIEKLAALFKSDDKKPFKKKLKSNPFNEVPDEVAETKSWEKKPEDGEKGDDAQEDGDQNEEGRDDQEGDEAGEGEGAEDEAAGEDGAQFGNDDEGDGGPGADASSGDEDGESAGDPDAEDDADDGEGNPFDGYEPGEDGAEDDADGAAVAGDGGAPNDVPGLIQAIVEQEKHYYAAKGMHGADHHKAGAQMDHYHALVRKLVRTLMAGPQGQAPDPGVQEAPDDQDDKEAPDGGKAAAKDSKGFPPKKKKPPFMSKEKAEETAKALIQEHYEVLQKAETAMRAKMGEFIDWSKKIGPMKEYDPAAEDKEDDEKTKLKAKAGNSLAATVTGKTGSGDPIAAGRGTGAGVMSGIGASSSSTPSASTMGSSSAAGQQAAQVSQPSGGGATSSGRGLHGKMKASPNSSAGQGAKAAGEGPTFKLPGMARSMDAIDALGAFAKASKGSEKAGHKYKKRVPDGKGGFNYFYGDESGTSRRTKAPLPGVDHSKPLQDETHPMAGQGERKKKKRADLASKIQSKIDGHNAAAAATKESMGVMATKKSFTDPAGRSLKKGLDVFTLPGTSVPDGQLYDYLCHFVEEALEREKRECAHQAPTTDTAEFWAGKVYGEFVGYRAVNKNLQRAGKKYDVTEESIAAILHDKGLVKTPSDSVSSGRDFWDAPTSRSSTMQFSQRAPWVQADPTAAVGRQIVKAEPEQALFIDDTRDPSQVVRERQAALHKAAWSVPEPVYAADNHGTCQIHGREVHKAMNLSNPHLKCTC